MQPPEETRQKPEAEKPQERTRQAAEPPEEWLRPPREDRPPLLPRRSPQVTVDTLPVTTSEPSPEATKEIGGLEVVETSMITDQLGIRYVTGTVRDNANQRYQYVKVEIVLYDTDGATVATLTPNSGATQESLQPGGTWRFKVAVVDGRVTGYRISGVTGF